MPAADIRDVKPPLDVSSGYGWLILLVSGILFLIGFFLWRRYQKNKQKILSPQKTIWEITGERLSHLEKKDFLSKGQLKEYYSELSDITRYYIEERFNIRAPEMTTEEFLHSLDSSSVMNMHQKEILKDFLQSCDLVKFARHEPQREEAVKAIGIVRKFVEETKGY